MNLTWEEIAERTGAHITGGSLILFRDKKHTVLGKLHNGVMHFTEAGRALKGELEQTELQEAIASADDTTKLSPKGGRKIAKAINDGVAADEDFGA